jgi:hypothetical protein
LIQLDGFIFFCKAPILKHPKSNHRSQRLVRGYESSTYPCSRNIIH